MTPPTDLLGSCAPSLVHAERDSRFVLDGDVTLAGHLCYIMLLPNAQGKIVKTEQFHDVSLTPHSLIYVSLRLRVQNAVPAQPCVGKLGISLVLLNFLHCNFRL